MFVAQLSLNDWLGSVGEEKPDRWFIQKMIKGGFSQGGAVETIATSIVLTAAKDDSSPLFFARIEVERGEIWFKKREVKGAVVERLRLAMGIITPYICNQLDISLVTPGLAFRPGLIEVLDRFQCDHDLWTWDLPKEKNLDPDDYIIRRRLLPIEQWVDEEEEAHAE